MREWYCYIAGRQYGPVTDNDLRRWAQEGRIRPADYVWTAGMTAWAPAQWVGGLFVGAPDVEPAPVGNCMVSRAAPDGTAGRARNRTLVAKATSLLRGKWGTPMALCLLSSLFRWGVQLVPVFGTIGGFMLAGPLQLGRNIFFLTHDRGGTADLAMMWRGFRILKKAFFTELLRGTLIGLALAVFGVGGLIVLTVAQVRKDLSLTPKLWGLLGFAPGIVAAYLVHLVYSQTLYLLADDRSLGPLEAMQHSRQMMRGFKRKRLLLWLRFAAWPLPCYLPTLLGFVFNHPLGWALLYLLCGLIHFVSSLWMSPYLEAAYAAFYDDLMPPATPPGEAEGEGAPAPGPAVQTRPAEQARPGESGEGLFPKL